MSRVVVLAHDGIRCALPAAQVVRAEPCDVETVPSLALFRRDGAEHAAAASTRSIVVRTYAGERALGCTDARFGWLPEERAYALPELLRDAMGLPHVVGVAGLEDRDWIWLVDLERLVQAPLSG